MKDTERGTNYWETLYAPADEAIEKLMVQYIAGGVTPVEVFLKIREFEIDFYPETDVCKETINKIIELMVETGEEDSVATDAYHTAQAATMFDKLILKHPDAKIKYYVNEYDGRDTNMWKFQDTEEAARKQFQGHIDYFKEEANNLHLYKALVQEIKDGEYKLIHDEVIDNHSVDF